MLFAICVLLYRLINDKDAMAFLLDAELPDACSSVASLPQSKHQSPSYTTSRDIAIISFHRLFSN
jgi:hypothetical protein